MEQRHIIFSENLEWTGLADIHLTNLPDTITTDYGTLLKKDEFHITLMAGKFLAPMIQLGDLEQALQSLNNTFSEFTTNHDLTQFTLTNEYYLVKHEERVSTVVLVDMPHLFALFDHLRQKYNNDAIPTQPAHITLYTLQPDKGIWLTSHEELHQKGQKIAPQELANLTVKSAAHA